MALIQYTDYIDFPALNAAIKELGDNNKQFGTLTENVFKGVKVNVDAVTQSMRDNLSVVQNFNVNQKNAVQGIQNLNKSNTELINKSNQYQQVEKNLSTLSEQLSKNNIILNGTVEKITQEYNSLSDTEEKDIARKKELITISDVLANAITKYNNTVSGTITTYNELKQQSKDAELNAKNLAVQFGADSNEAIEAANAAQVYADKLASINELIKKRPVVEQPVPFTTNIDEVNTENKNVSNAAGTVVNDAEIAATQKQLAATQELNAAKQQSIPISEEEASVNTQDAATSKLLSDAKDKLAFALSEVNVQLKGYALQTEQANAAAKLEAEQTLGLSGAYKRLTVDLAATKIEAKNLAAQFGVDSVQARQAVTSANLLDQQVKAIDKSVGESQRNVGNYSSAFTKGFSSIFSYVRQIAYILPGIGVAGIFTAVFGAITDVISSLKLFSSTATDAKEKQDELNTSVAGASSDFVQASTNVLKLQADVQLAKDGFISKNQVVKEYNDTLGDAIGKVSSLDGVEKALAAHSEDYIHAIFLRAIANQALEESSKKAFEAEQKRLQAPGESLTGYEKFTNKVNDIDNSIQNVLRSISNGIIDIQNLPTPFTGIVEQVQGVNDSLKDSKSSFEIFQDYLKQAEDFAKSHGIKLDSFIDTKGGKKNIDDSFEILKEQLEHDIKDLQSFVDQNSILFNERYQAASDEAKKETQLSNLIFDNDIKNGKNRVLAELENAFRIEDINKQLAVNLQKINTDRNKNQFPDLPIAAPIDNTEAQLAAHQKFINDFIAQIQKGSKAIQTQENINQLDEQAVLDDKHKKGILSETQYQQDTLNLQKKYDAIRLQTQIAALQAELTVTDANSDKGKEIEEQIKKLQALLEALGITAKNTAKDLSPIFDNLYKNLEGLSNIAGNNVASVFQDITKAFQKFAEDNSASLKDHIDEYAQIAISAGYAITDELNQADEARINNLEKNKDRELSLAQNNAAAQAAITDRYAKEEAKIKRKEAVNNKIAALFQIAINTAAAVLKVTEQTGIAAPFVIPFIIGLGAAEAAVVLAQPLPQFEKGTMYSPEGFAVVDEKGSELIVDKDGNLKEIGSDGPRITYLHKGDKVYTASQTKEILSHKKESVLNEIQTDELIKNVLHNEQQNNIVREINLQSTLTERIQQSKHAEAVNVMNEALKHTSAVNESMVTRLEKAIANIPVHQTLIDEEGVKERLKRAEGLTTYRNTLQFGYKSKK